MACENCPQPAIPNDIAALTAFYDRMKHEPYQVQKAAVDWLASRFHSDWIKEPITPGPGGARDGE